MKTYTVSNKPINVFGPRFNDKKIVERKAMNLNNLRKNLCAELKDGQIWHVYDDGGFKGVIGKLGKGSEVGWPEYMWIAKGTDYKVNPANGTIKRIPQIRRRF